MSNTTNQTVRVLELLKRFNNGQKVCIDSLSNDVLWYGKSEKTIRRDLDVIKEYFPESFELIKGEKGCYKAITKESFDKFITKDAISLMTQTFNFAQKYNLLDNMDITDSDKKILNDKIEKSKDCYLFISKPFESTKNDENLLKDIENSIIRKRYVTLKYKVNDMENTYIIKPYKIIFMKENLYLSCENTTEDFYFTNFRISNITSYKLDSKTFHINPDIVSFINQIQTPFSRYTPNFRNNLIDVVVEIDKSKSRFFEKKKFLPSQKIVEKKKDGNLILSFTVTQELEIEELIKSWIPNIKVISPISLKEKVKDDINKYIQLINE